MFGCELIPAASKLPLYQPAPIYFSWFFQRKNIKTVKIMLE
jgi:hypothetical protein